MDVREVVERRLAAQFITGHGASDVAEVVRSSLAVQCQDPPLSRYSLGIRARVDDAEVRSVHSSGQILRLHALRPTWHYLHRDDLRWVLRLTSPRVLRSLAGRHRQLGVTDQLREAAHRVLARELGQTALTRTELQQFLPHSQAPVSRGEVVGHLLMIAELDALICSGPLRDGEHTYRLVDDVVPLDRPIDNDTALQRLVSRFVRGRGPAAIADLQRWTKVTKTEARAALASSDLTHGVVDGVDLWWPDLPQPAGDGGVLLLPTFDETFLSHKQPRFPRLPGHGLGDLHFDPRAAGSGVVVVDGIDVGTFKRTSRAGLVTVTPELATRDRTVNDRVQTVCRAMEEFYDCR